MHPPPIAERSYIEFPESADLALTEVINDNTKLIERITNLENIVKNLENTNYQKQDEIDRLYVIIMPVGIIGVIIAIIALVKTRKN